MINFCLFRIKDWYVLWAVSRIFKGSFQVRLLMFYQSLSQLTALLKYFDLNKAFFTISDLLCVICQFPIALYQFTLHVFVLLYKHKIVCCFIIPVWLFLVICGCLYWQPKVQGFLEPQKHAAAVIAQSVCLLYSVRVTDCSIRDNHFPARIYAISHIMLAVRSLAQQQLSHNFQINFFA